MSKTVASLTLVVREYDEAIKFFTEALRFTLVEDTLQDGGKRWVLVAPSGSKGATILLAKADTPEEISHIGNQTGGRVFLFLHTSDFWEDYDFMALHGVRFAEKPRQEPYGQVVVFLDLYGNKWDLIQPVEA
jgi:catechol 2,3-dioxygenase-like lactoylglutathione lyase family enzyme